MCVRVCTLVCVCVCVLCQLFFMPAIADHLLAGADTQQAPGMQPVFVGGCLWSAHTQTHTQLKDWAHTCLCILGTWQRLFRWPKEMFQYIILPSSSHIQTEKLFSGSENYRPQLCASWFVLWLRFVCVYVQKKEWFLWSMSSSNVGNVSTDYARSLSYNLAKISCAVL